MDKSAFTVDEFCAAHGISPSFFYKLTTQGNGPRLMKLGYKTLVSAEAAAEWRTKMEAQTAQAKSEACKK